ncbi:hypothetical protein NTJ12_002497 [Flavobacterium psychrophilum]|nr:hypothetical protein [Flavobacterium psychrophilum]
MITEIFTEEEEIKCEIKITFRSENHGSNNECNRIQIDNNITPLFCCNCKNQLTNFYKLNGSRYGQVGTIKCNCGAEIHCTDSDNIVEYLDTLTTVEQNQVGKYHIDYSRIYKLNNEIFSLIKDKTGFDVFKQYSNQNVELNVIVKELETKYVIEKSREYSFENFKRLPVIINKWYSILETLEK